MKTISGNCKYGIHDWNEAFSSDPNTRLQRCQDCGTKRQRIWAEKELRWLPWAKGWPKQTKP